MLLIDWSCIGVALTWTCSDLERRDMQGVALTWKGRACSDKPNKVKDAKERLMVQPGR